MRQQAEVDRLLRKTKAEERGQRPGLVSRVFRAFSRRGRDSL
ncbi:MAG: hypothetical protein V3V35_06905 [Dehalococcoidia bacterium]